MQLPSSGCRDGLEISHFPFPRFHLSRLPFHPPPFLPGSEGRGAASDPEDEDEEYNNSEGEEDEDNAGEDAGPYDDEKANQKRREANIRALQSGSLEIHRKPLVPGMLQARNPIEKRLPFRVPSKNFRKILRNVHSTAQHFGIFTGNCRWKMQLRC